MAERTSQKRKTLLLIHGFRCECQPYSGTEVLPSGVSEPRVVGNKRQSFLD
jgi:hypothetical protein